MIVRVRTTAAWGADRRGTFFPLGAISTRLEWSNGETRYTAPSGMFPIRKPIINRTLTIDNFYVEYTR